MALVQMLEDGGGIKQAATFILHLSKLKMLLIWELMGKEFSAIVWQATARIKI
jgi:hypothetical protein